MSYVNINKIIDVQTAIAATPQGRRDFNALVFVFQGAQVGGKRTNYGSSLAEVVEIAGSNSEAVKAATTYFSGGFNGIKPSVFYFANFETSETWSDVVAELIADGSYYWMAIDNNFTVEENKTFMDAVEASTGVSASHFALIQDTTATAVTEDLETDSTSLLAYAAGKKMSRVACFYSDADLKDSYYQVAGGSYFGIVQFNTARPLGSLAHKQFSGIEACTLSAATTASMGYDNIIAKNGSVYTTYGEAGRSMMEQGNAANGTDIAIKFAADYLDYTITYNIYDLLISLPALRFDTEGKGKLYNAISTAFEDLKDAGVISGGTDSDTGTTYLSGYSISIPLDTLTAAEKATGKWSGITCVGLLSGFAKTISITNTLQF